MPLAETFTFTPGEVAAILAVLALVFATWLTAAVLGFRFAARAARGDQKNLALWAVAAVVVLLPAYPAGLGSMVTVVSLLVVVLQVVAYARARNDGGGPPA